MQKHEHEKEFLACFPKRNREWETSDKKNSVLLIPKFGDHLVGKWLMSKMKNPNYRLNLDEIGTFVWENCDGKQDVQTIGEKLKKHFGENIEPVYDRLKLFFMSLQRSKSITWH